MGIIVLALRCYLVFQNVFITFKTLKPPPPSSRNNGQPSVRALTQRKRDMKGCMAIWIVWCCLALYESLVERIVWVVIPFYDELKSVVLIFLILSRARTSSQPYVSTLDAVLNFVHNLGDFVLLILSLPFSAAISWWYGPSTDEDQTRLTEADTESVRSYGDEHPATSTSKLRSDYPNQRNHRASSTSKEAPRPGVETENGHNTHPRGVSRETRNPSDTLHSRFYTATDTSQNHQIWYPPSSYADANEVRADNPTSVPPMTMPEPQFSSIDVDDWRAYPPFPSAYPSTPVRPPQANMPEPVHPSQFCAIEEEGTGGPITSNDQTDGARQGFGRSLLPLREPSNLGSDGDLSDEIKNLGVQIHETHYVTSSDNDEDMDDYETEEDSFDVTFQTPDTCVFFELCLWDVKSQTPPSLPKRP
ncbi:hypothetical protein B0F90DRAFT_1813897 [Multifurca ochricompacta]|uniref:Uncharacterized protein n=1 Tax=Multifurca ochricompacta TaxID=376703 RepID=A0AAD4MDJ2_9AGAM|nr:hypothetical protein B0F90DRAFT_1813897 [Multifurca ochricompacta]